MFVLHLAELDDRLLQPPDHHAVLLLQILDDDQTVAAGGGQGEGEVGQGLAGDDPVNVLLQEARKVSEFKILLKFTFTGKFCSIISEIKLFPVPELPRIMRTRSGILVDSL